MTDKTPKQIAKEALKQWAIDFPIGKEVAVVQDDASRKIGLIHGKPALNSELGIESDIAYEDQPGEITIKVNAKRIRPRAIETKKTSNPLRVLLTDAEKLDTGAAVADGLAEVGMLEAELATVKKQYQGKIQAASAVVSSKSELLRNGYEIRPVDCLLTLDFDIGKATEVRKDTGKQVEYRSLMKSEMERELPLLPEVHQSEPEEPEEELPEVPSAPIEITAEEVEKVFARFVETQRVSTASAQRCLEVGFTHATMIMDELEKRGLITAPSTDGNHRDLIEKSE
jgi:hypothetical protein